jgi:hypothetical protein
MMSFDDSAPFFDLFRCEIKDNGSRHRKNVFQTIFGQFHSQMAQRVNSWDREGEGHHG